MVPRCLTYMPGSPVGYFVYTPTVCVIGIRMDSNYPLEVNHALAPSWTVGQVPTPHGALAVKWGRMSSGGFDMDVTAPNGTSGTIAVPVSGPNTTITVNGTPVWIRGTFAAGTGG